MLEHWHWLTAATGSDRRIPEKASVDSRLAAGSLAFEFLVLSAARWGEVRDAEWTEIDTAGRLWTIAATRMKMKRGHGVPLCRRATEILDAARTLADGAGRFVFPGRGGKPLHDRSLRRLLQQHRIAAVPCQRSFKIPPPVECAP